ncbi:UNVERIFIED_CONTAM: Early nodulin-93 [Sesamum indicum]
MGRRNVGESPLERSTLVSLDQKLALAKRCSHEGVVAGAKAAVVATIATAIPTNHHRVCPLAADSHIDTLTLS